MNFDNWMRANKLAEKTVRNYHTAMEGSLSVWARNAGLIKGSLLDILDAKQMERVSREIKKIDLFIARDTVGKGMYSAALAQYTRYLKEFSDKHAENDILSEDIQVILEDVQASVAEKLQLVNARIGQGQYRKKLIELWGACSVTGYPDCSILVASHIKPWSLSTAEEKLDKFNGILLLPNLDKLFDKGLISFDDTGAILIARSLEQFETLGIQDDMFVSLKAEHEVYMKYHREFVFLDALLYE